MLSANHNNKIKTIHILLLTAILIFLPCFVLASSTEGTIDTTHKHAWSENIGWINFNFTAGDVHVTDSGLSGYAWSKNYGRINLNPSVSGVSNNGAGNLSGLAWGENIGLIDFSGVTIDSDGYFSGYASGTITGQINFNCANNSACDSLDYKVRTDWRPQSARPACNNALDDDGDGLTDYPTDKGCESLTDDNEINPGSGFLPLRTRARSSSSSNDDSSIIPVSDSDSEDVQAESINESAQTQQQKQDNILAQIADESAIIEGHNEYVDLDDQSKKLYDLIIKKIDTESATKTRYRIAFFITYGTQTTQPLGKGERAGVVHSYQKVYNKLPDTGEEWEDVIKIANGRFPKQQSIEKEKQALKDFTKIYKKLPDFKNQNDEAAIKVIAYGIRPKNRNLNSEELAIQIFKAIYNKTPATTQDWDIARAIAYSGATR